MHELNRIKKKRSDKNADIILNFTCTAINANDDWSYEQHEPKQICGNQLALHEKYGEDSRTVSYDFLYYDIDQTGSFVLSETKSIAILYSKLTKEYYATLCIEKTLAEVRREKIALILSN